MFWAVFTCSTCFGKKCGRPIFGVVPSILDLMITSQESSVVSKSPGQYVHLNNYKRLLQWRYCKAIVKSLTQRILDRRKQYKMIIFGKGVQIKRETEQLSLGNGEVEGRKISQEQ